MYTVLMPVDENEDYADAQVDALLSLPANRDDLSVTVVHVHGELDRQSETLGTAFVGDLDESIVDGRDPPQAVTNAVEKLRDAGIEVELREMVGKPVDGILEAAETIDADAILIAGRKSSTVGKVLFGSVSQKVIVRTDRVVILAD